VSGLTRRGLVMGGAGLTLAGCDRIVGDPGARAALRAVEGWNRRVAQAAGPAMAREFTLADLSPSFQPNGTLLPRGATYQRHVRTAFADWRLLVDGLVARPLALGLPALKAMPQRTQITRHDCVEGWSAIGQWTGPTLGHLLRLAGLKPEARFVVIHCADNLQQPAGADSILVPGQYYESLDLDDAFHPQTILAWGMNGGDLPVRHGAPLRLRVERHLGYKHAKYVTRLEAVADFPRYGRGKGSYWADRGYEWWSGI
jgi:DMSO/TMAO reductase YedYZ molybdopterin-dependent catalytic subunit